MTNLDYEKRLVQILAEHQIGFVVGDKDVNEHLAKFKAALTTLTEEVVDEKVRELTPITIMGKTLDEVVVIFSALELERIADMKMTMSKLDDWMKLVREDHHKAVQKALDKTFKDFTEQRTTATKILKGENK